MQFEMAGKGVVCNVYYIEKQKLDQISLLVRETGPSLKDLLLEHSDYIINVSRGFFSDNSQAGFKFTLSNGETIEQSIFEDTFPELTEQDDWDGIGRQLLGYSIINALPRDKDATTTQVGIVEYHHFESGKILIDLGECDEKSLKTFRLLCESVDRAGPAGSMDLATTATYEDGVVGTEDYGHGEWAINGIRLGGNDYPLPEATFETSHSRVWLWVYDENIGKHDLDFFGSQTLPDPWVVD